MYNHMYVQVHLFTIIYIEKSQLLVISSNGCFQNETIWKSQLRQLEKPPHISEDDHGIW